MFRWRIALLVSAAVAISYLDRQTLPWAIKAIQADIPISNQAKAFLDSAFLVAYGVMYLGGGRLLDVLGTKRGFFVVMIFWSLACASHGLAGGVLMLATSRLLLGIGEGGGFPAATRVIAEWFPVEQRSAAMGIINAGSAVGAVVAPPLIAWVLTDVGWFGLAHWRWVFFLTGAFGLGWAAAWWKIYFLPENVAAEVTRPASEPSTSASLLTSAATAPLRELLRHREIQGVVAAKFMSDAAWYFYIFWLPKYLFDAHHFDIKAAGAVGWIPYAASGVGSLCGGWLCSDLLRRGASVNAARKIAAGLSAAVMPCVMFVPHVPSVAWVIALFSVAFAGQQSWSTIVMVLPTDLVPRASVGTVAGLIGLGGAMGGVVLGQLAGYLLDHGFSYTPILIIAGSLHVMGFVTICFTLPRIAPLSLSSNSRA